MWPRLCLTVVCLLSALGIAASAQTTVSVTAIWDLASDHLVTDTWELEANGVLVPCVDVQVSQAGRRCRAQVPAGSTTFRLRGLRDGVAGDWSGPGVPGATPGAFTIDFVHAAAEPPPTPMAATITNKTNAITTSDPATTASLTWTAGSRGLVVLAVARSAEGGTSGNLAVTGGLATWNLIGEQIYSTRRMLVVFLSDGTPNNGTLSISDASVLTQEFVYSVEEIAGHTGAVVGTVITAEDVVGTSPLDIGDVGTPGADDIVFAAAGAETASNSLAITGFTNLSLQEAGGNVRSLVTAWHASDDTPEVTWNAAGNGTGGIAFIILGAGGGAVAAVPVKRLGLMGVGG